MTVDLPRSLVLTPISRRPLRLRADTIEHVLTRPVPTTVPDFAGAAPVLSVVVPTFNGLAFTRMALESVLADHPALPYEIVVVDNGSSDGTPEYLSTLSGRVPHVHVLRNGSNRGFATAINQGVDAARGDILVFLNNDTVVPPGCLARLGAHLSDATIGVAGPATNRCGNEAEVPIDYGTYDELITFAERRARVERGRVFDLPVAMMFCAALRRDVYQAVGPLDERFEIGMFEDDDYSRRVREAGWRVVCAEDVFVHHFAEATIGELVASGRYADVFVANRRRHEKKWGVEWDPHRRRDHPRYQQVRRRLHALVRHHVRPGSTALVISKGDDSLLAVPEIAARHFPQLPDGSFAGHHPAHDADAIMHLEDLCAAGASYLVVPAPSLWWLEYYQGFARHLDARGELLALDPNAGAIFRLPTSRAGVDHPERSALA